MSNTFGQPAVGTSEDLDCHWRGLVRLDSRTNESTRFSNTALAWPSFILAGKARFYYMLYRNFNTV